MKASERSEAKRRSGTPSTASAVTRLSTTIRLFLSGKQGNSRAVSALFSRLLPGLTHWAGSRLPRWARARMDTGDLVQEALLGLFRRLPEIEPRRQRALRAYLRTAINNRIRDEVRRANSVEVPEVSGIERVSIGPSPHDQAVAEQDSRRYKEALLRLGASDQKLIVGRLELDFSYDQLALATGKASPDAARVAVRRAIGRLAAEMKSG